LKGRKTLKFFFGLILQALLKALVYASAGEAFKCACKNGLLVL
jgi:hypothetical protein